MFYRVNWTESRQTGRSTGILQTGQKLDKQDMNDAWNEPVTNQSTPPA